MFRFWSASDWQLCFWAVEHASSSALSRLIHLSTPTKMSASANGVLRSSPGASQGDPYTNLTALGVLGLIEAVLGLACLCTEIAGFSALYELQRSYTLEIVGILIAFNTMFSGLFGFLTKLELVELRARHCMFLLGILLTLVSGSEAFIMLMVSMRKATHYYNRYQNNNSSVYDVLANNATVLKMEHEPYKEEHYIMFFLRSLDAVLYGMLGFLFLASFLLNCRNLRRIQKRGHGFFPDYRTAREGKDKLEKKKTVRFNEKGERIVMDQHGSSWMVNTEEDGDNRRPLMAS